MRALHHMFVLILRYSLLVVGLLHTSCQSHTFQYKDVPTGLLQKTYSPINNFEPGTVDLQTKIKRHTDSSTHDDTHLLQSLISKYKKVVLPPWPIYINDSGLSIPSGARIYFAKGSKIIMLPSDKTHFDIIKIYDVKDVKIYNANIEGERSSHRGITGEWAAGIGIRNSTDIELRYGNIKNTWGDGLFVGSESGGVSKNVAISNFNIDNARRNGISLTSGINVKFDSITISNTNGTAPECGVDIEPSLPSEYLDAISFADITTFNNSNSGFNINPNVFSSKDKNLNKKLDIAVLRHRDYGSAFGFSYSIDANDFPYKPAGQIIYKDGFSSAARRDAVWKTSNSKKINVLVDNFVVETNTGRKKLNDKNF